MPKRLASKHAKAANNPTQDFRAILRSLAHNRSSVMSVFDDFTRMTACCLAMQTREDEYLQRAGSYSKDELHDKFARAMGYLINEMHDKPFQDVLGVYYTQSIASADQTARGEFYTPQPVSKAMAAMVLNIDEIKADNKPVTICDPCSGSGAIILACAENLAPHIDLMRVTLQDINPVACDMAYINTTLWGIPAEIILGNTLANERRAHWKNIHWHRVGEDQRQAANKMLNIIRELEPPEAPGAEQPTASTVDDTASIHPLPAGPHEQLGLF